MKMYSKFLFLVMAVTMMVYSSCRKAEKAPALATTAAATSTNSDEAVSSQIAVNLSNSLAGAYGGVNANDAVDSVSVEGHLGPHHGSPSSALCGFFADSMVNYDWHSGDTVRSHTGGNLTFYFDCNHGRPSGYTAYDSLNTIGVAQKYAFKYTVKQYYTIKCFDQQRVLNDVNGDIYAYVGFKYFDSRLKPNIANANYTLKDLTVDVPNHDVLSGFASFVSYGSNNYGDWKISGVIVFLGHHRAAITLNGKRYLINLITGKLTQ